MTTRADDADERWQVDLMNVISFHPEENDGFKYLLIIMDVFSRKLTVVPLYDKSSKEASSATELVFMTTGRIPKSITNDSGSEFESNHYKRICRKYDIHQFFTIPNVTHASVAERVIKTLRMKIGKYMTHNNTTRYIDVLGDIVDGYNNSIHSSIDSTPNDAASSPANRQIALFNLKNKLNESPANKRWKRVKIFPGDVARIPILPLRRFRKSHEPSFSTDEYRIHQSHADDKHRPVARFIVPTTRQVTGNAKNLTTHRVLKRLYFYPNELSQIHEQ